MTMISLYKLIFFLSHMSEHNTMYTVCLKWNEMEWNEINADENIITNCKYCGLL